jgi:hypothetical protein
MANQVTLTFAGKTTDLEAATGRAGKATEVMAVRVTQATNQSAERFDHLSAQSSLLSGGIGDVGGALTEAFGENTAIGAFGAKLESASAVVTGFTGVMDLGVFATNNFKIASAAQAVQTGITSAATKAAAAAQWLMNTALLASPITWIVVGIVALIAVIVLIATKTDWFSKAWRASWKWIKDAASDTWEFMKKLPGWIGTAFAKVAGFISAPYRAAFNMIARAWNATVGRLSFTFPSWIPGIGGNNISVPNLPTFHAGGIVPGVVGRPTMIMAQAGERVGSLASGVGGGGEWITVDLGELGDALLEPISRAVARRGGQATHLGIRVVNGAVRA